MGDRRTAALTPSARSAGVALCLLSLGLLLAACTTKRSAPRKSAVTRPTPAVAEAKSGVRGDFARFDVIEIAVQRPGGTVAGVIRVQSVPSHSHVSSR